MPGFFLLLAEILVRGSSLLLCHPLFTSRSASFYVVSSYRYGHFTTRTRNLPSGALERLILFLRDDKVIIFVSALKLCETGFWIFIKGLHKYSREERLRFLGILLIGAKLKKLKDTLQIFYGSLWRWKINKQVFHFCILTLEYNLWVMVTRGVRKTCSIRKRQGMGGLGVVGKNILISTTNPPVTTLLVLVKLSGM